MYGNFSERGWKCPGFIDFSLMTAAVLGLHVPIPAGQGAGSVVELDEECLP